MDAFKKHTGTVALIDRSNIDTDQIISKEHLKSIKRTGFGPALFSDWRYLPDGSENPDFELNRAEYKGATILIAGTNFGCGSSREHAVWAIMQFGFKVVIAPAFADIFKGNAAKNGLLLVELSESELVPLKTALMNNEGLAVTIDLELQSITAGGLKIDFAIDTGTKNTLLHGLDDIGISLTQEAKITAFEKSHDVQM